MIDLKYKNQEETRLLIEQKLYFQGKSLPKRSLFFKLKEYIDTYLQENKNFPWINISGVRGVGKTVLLFQLYEYITKELKIDALYFSIDRFIQYYQKDLKDLFDLIQESEGSFLKLKKPLFIFLDEVHCDPNWAKILKTIYDTSSNVFIIATGSSAIDINQTADGERRSLKVKLSPLSFTEYLSICFDKKIKENIKKELGQALFESKNAQEAFKNIKTIYAKEEVQQFLASIEKKDIWQYIKYGSLPLVSQIDKAETVSQLIYNSLNKVISQDIKHIDGFSLDTSDKILSLLNILAISDIVSVDKLSNSIAKSKPTIIKMLDVLKSAEIINRIPPYYNLRRQIGKPFKNLFYLSSHRYAILFNTPNKTQIEKFEGSLREDIVGFYLTEYFSVFSNKNIFYDPNKNSADFIVQIGDKKIAIEVGQGHKDFSQLEKTNQNYNIDYGFNICSNDLSINDKYINIPFNLFLLIL